METKTIPCPVREEINQYCSCPKVECSNHGLCCQCILAHKNRTEASLLKRFPHCLRGLVEEAVAKGLPPSE